MGTSAILWHVAGVQWACDPFPHTDPNGWRHQTLIGQSGTEEGPVINKRKLV